MRKKKKMKTGGDRRLKERTMWRPSFFCKLAIKVFFRSARAVAAAVGRTYADDTSNGRPAVSLSISVSLGHTNTQRLFHGVTSLMHQAKTDTVTHLPPPFFFLFMDCKRRCSGEVEL